MEHYYFKHGFPLGYKPRSQIDGMKNNSYNHYINTRNFSPNNNTKVYNSNKTNIVVSEEEYQYLVNLMKF